MLKIFSALLQQHQVSQKEASQKYKVFVKREKIVIFGIRLPRKIDIPLNLESKKIH